MILPYPDRAVHMISRRSLLGGLVLAGNVGVRPTFAVDDGPHAFIQRLGDETLVILQAPAAAQEEKFIRLKALMERATDLNLVAKLVLGRHWRTATPEQQQTYTELFSQLVMQSMAQRMSWYSGQTFEIIGVTPVDERDTMVETRIIRPSGAPPIKVNWRVRKGGGEAGYQLNDIVAEGVSLVVTQRSEVSEIVGTRGIDGLLAEMRSRLERRDGL